MSVITRVHACSKRLDSSPRRTWTSIMSYARSAAGLRARTLWGHLCDYGLHARERFRAMHNSVRLHNGITCGSPRVFLRVPHLRRRLSVCHSRFCVVQQLSQRACACVSSTAPSPGLLHRRRRRGRNYKANAAFDSGSEREATPGIHNVHGSSNRSHRISHRP